MEILLFINNYVKYFYFLIIILLVVVVIKLLITLVKLGNSFIPIINSLNNINESVNEINEKAEIIENSINTSLPFFTKVVTTAGTLKFLFKIKKNKKKKSIRALLKYPNRINEILNLSKEIVTFIKEC